MTSVEENKLAQNFAMLAAYYQKQIPDVVLKMYARDLNDLDFKEVCGALERYRQDPKNRSMPLPAQIRAILGSAVDSDSAAREIAGRIAGAVVKHGFYQGTEAREYIGEIGWTVVTKLGGWGHICTNLGVSIDPTAFYAQVRDLAKTQIMYEPKAIDRAIGIGASKKSTGELESASELIKRILPAKESP